MSTVEDLFHPVVELPEPVRADRYRRLVGVDDIKDRLRREAELLADPGLLRAWAAEHHPAGLPALALFTDRPPLFVFAGDVGCGKTALAESFGCDLADSLNLPVFLYRLKLTARGSGLVGEMTTLIGDAFAHLLARGRKARGARGPGSVLHPGRRRSRRSGPVPRRRADAPRGPRGCRRSAGRRRQPGRRSLSRCSSSCAPIGSVRSTRLSCAAPPGIFHFDRPGDAQRHAVLIAALDGVGIDDRGLSKLAALTGPDGDRTRVSPTPT